MNKKRLERLYVLAKYFKTRNEYIYELIKAVFMEEARKDETK